MHIVQIAPQIGSGSGVAGVAYNLEREFAAMGHEVERFTLVTAGRRIRPWPKRTWLSLLALFRQTVWFSTVGTLRARRFLRQRPGAVSICHNSVMTGHVYVNHGIVGQSMRARGKGAWRMVRNPTHSLTFVRDLIRYRSRMHRAVVVLAPSERAALQAVYGRVRPETVLIPHGVDLERFHPPDPQERAHARAQFRLDEQSRVALFVGHEFGRKGLEYAIAGLVHAPEVLLLVAGGDVPSLAAAQAQAERAGVAQRVLFMGPRHGDLPIFFAAADMFVLPSAYESYGLVILEALACGLPVIATSVGCAPEVIVDGENGFLVERNALAVGTCMARTASAGRDAFSDSARRTAEQHSWRHCAEQYIGLLERLQERGS